MITKVIKNEGWSGLFKGVLPPLIGTTPGYAL
jgi:hypothetical protein